MDYVILHEEPAVKMDYMVMAFAGWPDAGEGATSALRHLQRTMHARKFAEVDPEEFYDFTQVRPYTSITNEGLRKTTWPANELFYCETPNGGHNLMLFFGVEPNLRWRTYSEAIIDIGQRFGVKKVVQMGALLDATPHSREVQISGSANQLDLLESLKGLGIQPSSYRGPSGVTSAVTDACSARDIPFASIWGHTPHYLQAAPNLKVSYALVKNLSRLLGIEIEMDELRSAAGAFEQEIEKAISKDAQISAYVKKLEERYDEALTLEEMPQPEELVKDLEAFLKEQQRRNGEDRVSP